jgi:hypothetical protein
MNLLEWSLWGQVLYRITSADFKQVHRYKGIGESEKLNRIAKGGVTDMQTGILQAGYLQYLTSAYAQSTADTIGNNIRDLQHYRVQILWRIQSS